MANKLLKNAYCTDQQWIGRAYCEKCHIRKLMLFSELPESAFSNLLQPINHFIHAPGSVLYQAETNKNFIYSIRRGMVKLVHVEKDGRKSIVRLLGPGAALGLELLDGSECYHHTAVTVDEVDLCKIPTDTLLSLENNYPNLCERIRQQLQDQLDFSDRWIVALGSGAAKQRVAQLLLILNEYFIDVDGTFLLLSGEDMAAMIGIAVETVSRTIAEFKREKILFKISNNHYKCDVTALRDITQKN